MTTARETAVAALVAAIDGGTTATVLRDASRPETLPGAGLVVVREGVAEQTDVVLSPLTYHWRQAVTAECYVTGAAQSTRIAALETLLGAIGTALDADRRLGGAVDFIEIPEPPQITEDADAGTVTIRQAIVPLYLYYHAASALA